MYGHQNTRKYMQIQTPSHAFMCKTASKHKPQGNTHKPINTNTQTRAHTNVHLNKSKQTSFPDASTQVRTSRHIHSNTWKYKNTHTYIQIYKTQVHACVRFHISTHTRAPTSLTLCSCQSTSILSFLLANITNFPSK